MTHQLQGLSWLLELRRNGTGGILGDMMGFGKTLQILSLLQYVKERPCEEGTNITNLVVCPKSVLGTWEDQAAKFCPGLTVLKLSGQSRQREHAKELLRQTRGLSFEK